MSDTMLGGLCLALCVAVVTFVYWAYDDIKNELKYYEERRK